MSSWKDKRGKSSAYYADARDSKKRPKKRGDWKEGLGVDDTSEWRSALKRDWVDSRQYRRGEDWEEEIMRGWDSHLTQSSKSEWDTEEEEDVSYRGDREKKHDSGCQAFSRRWDRGNRVRDDDRDSHTRGNRVRDDRGSCRREQGRGHGRNRGECGKYDDFFPRSRSDASSCHEEEEATLGDYFEDPDIERQLMHYRPARCGKKASASPPHRERRGRNGDRRERYLRPTGKQILDCVEEDQLSTTVDELSDRDRVYRENPLRDIFGNASSYQTSELENHRNALQQEIRDLEWKHKAFWQKSQRTVKDEIYVWVLLEYDNYGCERYLNNFPVVPSDWRVLMFRNSNACGETPPVLGASEIKSHLRGTASSKKDDKSSLTYPVADLCMTVGDIAMRALERGIAHGTTVYMVCTPLADPPRYQQLMVMLQRFGILTFCFDGSKNISHIFDREGVDVSGFRTEQAYRAPSRSSSRRPPIREGPASVGL